MDKILAFSILSSSPADLSAPGFSTRLSWRTSAAGKPQQAEAPAPPKQQEKEKAAERRGPPAKASRPRFAPEFDGLNCFESIVSI